MWYTLPELIRSQTFHSESPSRTSWPLFRGRFGDLLGSCRALLVENLPPMKKTIAALAAALFLFPSLSMAAGLNYQQASSIIVLLEAFSVNQATINEVWGFIAPEDTPLTPPTVATTQDTSPSLQPVFGGTSNPQAQVFPTQVAPVQIQPIATTQPTVPVTTSGWSILLSNQNEYSATSSGPINTSNSPTVEAQDGMVHIQVSAYDPNKVYQKIPITVTTDDPDLPASWTFNADPHKINFFCVAPTYPTFPDNGCVNAAPVSVGTFIFTFTAQGATTTEQVTVLPSQEINQ